MTEWVGETDCCPKEEQEPRTTMAFPPAVAYLSKREIVRRPSREGVPASPWLGVQWETKPTLNGDHKTLHPQGETSNPDAHPQEWGWSCRESPICLSRAEREQQRERNKTALLCGCDA